MKAIKVSELKAHLSKYLRMAARGSRIIVHDRDEPIAVLGPPEAASSSWQDRMARDGRLQLGSQNWSEWSATTLSRPVDIQASLAAVREDPDEVRRH